MASVVPTAGPAMPNPPEMPDEAEPRPDSSYRMTVAVCHHCGRTIAKNTLGEWEHISFTGLDCD